MNILALDSSDQFLSVALSAKNGDYYIEVDPLRNAAGPSHSELLLECSDILVKTAGISPKELNMVACMKGPGSFTGLRIAFASAKGLSLSLGIPLVALPTLDCIAYPFSYWPGLVLPSIDAKKGCFFAAFYSKAKRLTDYMDASPEELIREAEKTGNYPGKPILLTGGGAKLLYDHFSAIIPELNVKSDTCVVDKNYRRGNARELLELVKSDKIEVVNYNDSAPIYLRKSDAELNWG